MDAETYAATPQAVRPALHPFLPELIRRQFKIDASVRANSEQVPCNRVRRGHSCSKAESLTVPFHLFDFQLLAVRSAKAGNPKFPLRDPCSDRGVIVTHRGWFRVHGGFYHYRRHRIGENGVVSRLICSLLVLFAVSPATSGAEDYPFLGIGLTNHYVPEGKPKRQAGISTVERCQAACASNHGCKAFAFRTSMPACYFYSRFYMGGTPLSRELGLYSSALSIVPKKGYVSAFKHSSYPPPPVMIPRPR